MATLVLSAVGSAVGGAIGGSVLGVSAAAIGQLAGATVGRSIDQKILGGGSAAVEVGRLDRLRLTGASEGAPVGDVYGRMRVPGQVIWASQFLETYTDSGGGGKGAPSQPETRSYSYSVNLAIGLCNGEITHVGRVWADGVEIERESLTINVHKGSFNQLPDQRIEAIEGVGSVPAYRGLAYVVLEDFSITPYGNRVPQLTFEVFRPAPVEQADDDVARMINAVALMPGTGEFAYATEPVYITNADQSTTVANVHTPSGATDFVTSLNGMAAELPNCKSVSLIVSWFGDDLRCGECQVLPKVENASLAVDGQDWQVSGMTRNDAGVVPFLDGRPVYGGTPSDHTVFQALTQLATLGQKVMFYPFLLMEQLSGNSLPDPYGAVEQPKLPWRGRITSSIAPGLAGTPDGTSAMTAEIEAFFGTAEPGDFVVSESEVSYTGSANGGYRRFILHYAHLCAAAGGIDSFCIGSEMRGLTQLRDAVGFHAVTEFKRLASDVRAILGPNVKIGYAADWSEYFGYQPQDGSGDRYFHLDPLWADQDIDFIGIDNYMPLSDWRDGLDHLDAGAKHIYNLDYLRSNIEGGEGFDWYYHSEEARDAQIRTPITDGAHNEPWIYRYKDIRSFWDFEHFERVGGIRSETPTAWVPRSKPIWFTELGCPAADKGTNQPNKFLDPKSSESSLPHYSNGRRDELIQAQYLRAMHLHWADPNNNPTSEVYGGAMVDMSRAHVWAWDARPFPFFPNALDVWSDGENYTRGHWINGRSSARSLSSVVEEVTGAAGINEIDTSELFGFVRGYCVPDANTPREALQPLLTAYASDVVERDGVLRFKTRTGECEKTLIAEETVLDGEEQSLSFQRESEADLTGRIKLDFVEAEGNYEVRSTDALWPEDRNAAVTRNELNLALTKGEAKAISERWLSEARVAQDSAQFLLPPSMAGVSAGDVVQFSGSNNRYRIDFVEDMGFRKLRATRIDSLSFVPGSEAEGDKWENAVVVPVPLQGFFLDLPSLNGSEGETNAKVALTAKPWSGSGVVYSSNDGNSQSLIAELEAPAVTGRLLSALNSFCPGRVQSASVDVLLLQGALESVGRFDLLAGRNLAALGDGSPDRWEVFQFQTAELVGPSQYRLSGLLRGQGGSDPEIAQTWGEGTLFVLIDGRIADVPVSLSERNLERTYHYGNSNHPISSPSYRSQTLSFEGRALRPRRPCHLAALSHATGTELSWIRRSRLEGDYWETNDVPLGELSERYQVEIWVAGALVRNFETTTPSVTYTDIEKAADGASSGFEFRVAQVSDVYGPGAWAAKSV